jgi:bifunctional DNA-binding transcriptional regulator/antitoxin component of YhaV-PrlF toxin-antitoxin module
MTKTPMRVGTDGRAQIPYDVRVKLGIKEGDQIIVEIESIITPMRVGTDGRAQIPYDVRVKLGIKEGDQITVEIESIIHEGRLKSTMVVDEFLRDESEQTIH